LQPGSSAQRLRRGAQRMHDTGAGGPCLVPQLGGDGSAEQCRCAPSCASVASSRLRPAHLASCPARCQPAHALPRLPPLPRCAAARQSCPTLPPAHVGRPPTPPPPPAQRSRSPARLRQRCAQTHPLETAPARARGPRTECCSGAHWCVRVHVRACTCVHLCVKSFPTQREEHTSDLLHPHPVHLALPSSALAPGAPDL